MKNGKLELAMYYFFDRTWLERHFERMARKGWALDRMGIFWHYHRIEPRTLHYAISYFTGGGYYEPPSEGEITFEEYCAEAGWELPVSDYLQSLHTQSSLFLSQLTAEQIPEESWQEEEGEPFYLQYVLTKVQAGFLYDLTRDSMMKAYSGEQGWQESQEWNLSDGTVEQVYETSVQEASFPLNRYIVCMGDRVLKIDLSFVPDSRQQETIVNILEAV